jgi:hypothetical protein
VHTPLTLDLVTPLYLALAGTADSDDTPYQFVVQQRLLETSGPLLQPLLPGSYPREDEEER